MFNKGVEPKDVPSELRLSIFILLRYGHHLTFAEIGEAFGISRQRVHQVMSSWENEVLEYLQENSLFYVRTYRALP